MTPQEEKTFGLVVQRLQAAEEAISVAKHLLRALIFQGKRSKGYALLGYSLLDYIKKAVAEEFDLPVAWIEAGRQRQSVVKARHAAFYLCRRLTSASLPEIGESFGKHHTTVFHGIQNIERALANGSAYARRVRQLEVKLRQQCQPTA